MTINPFHREHADAWSSDFVDVPSLNKKASDTIGDAVRSIQDAAGGDASNLRSQSILVLGPAGAGKTHLFARLRRSLGRKAAFVLVRPELGVDPTPRHILSTVMDALGRKSASSDKRQLDVIVGAFLAQMRDTDSRWAHVVLEELAAMDEAARELAIEEVLEKIEDLYDELDIGWLELFLRAPFMKRASRRAALKWLSGLEPNERELKRIGYNAPLPDESVVGALRTVALVATFGAPILLVFDQLENLVDGDDTTRVTAHANLVSELFDSVRGLVLVQMALDAEWDRRIQPVLSESQRSRLEAKVLLTRMPSPAEREQLVKAWVAKLPADESKPFPWPFADEDWNAIAKRTVMTPRMLMIACREAMAGGSVLAPEAEPKDALGERLQELWDEQVEEARKALDHEWEEHGGLSRTRLVSALVATLKLAGITSKSAASRPKHDLVTKTKKQECWVYAMQHPHPRSVSAVLKEAASESQKRPTLVVREQAMAFPPTWKASLKHLDLLRQTKKGAWLPLDRGEVVDMLALHDFVTSARSQDLSADDGMPIAEAAVLEWIRSTLNLGEWPVVSAVRGDAPTKSEASEPVAPDAPSGTATQVAEPKPSYQPTQLELGSQGDGAVGIVAALGVASVDRIVREVRARHGTTPRKDIVAELRKSAGVRWFGDAIVHWRAK